ncbi:C-5 cytosine-specific DNA methylase (plasmid) [Trichormus variabilis ATCC 29413]|uniref:DNA (cytosine-5-)-methyltransferase n=2 Tax=Anabaena variabilis TaxID=264691 RepID=Q3M1U6_TRIV2|nr:MULTISPECIES: DNA cytosine methyltransferase [Nostocaceae]ABA25040.1 C-5 cytosine-specific DNA methylase [Trichormus variabilis ATCC 29413]MBC1217926.1 DNA cytosine methyltransferase [Trichormus variabilis ARAD]MBC1259122.1 DNA cytosine methyltransferase [Trichormus variabilis V5]MBC1270673.1 DNA cytosine methyltransferase [Trichormus variabilis FSR]MBC1305527.1 DNA cytosine methyltransferase [Trichormus variabilis N2B]
MKSVLSLFSGIGGLCHHGIAAAGLSHKFQVRQFVEISPYSQSVLRYEQPQTPIHSDITTYHCNRGQFDILCGGFPCAGTSNSGNRQGLSDPRSALWAEQFRIIESDRPAIALIENPTGLLYRGLEQIIYDFDSIGYMGEWNCISAQQVGLSHQRKRIFIIAYPDGLFNRQQQAPWTNQIGNHITQVRLSLETRSYQPGVLAVAHGIPIGVAKNISGNYDARRAYGLSCSPRQSAVAWKRIDYLCSLLSYQEAF